MHSLKYSEKYGNLLFSSELFDPSLNRLTARDNIKHRTQILRESNQVVIKKPKDPLFESVPPQLTVNHRQENFLQCDTGPGKQSTSSAAH